MLSHASSFPSHSEKKKESVGGKKQESVCASDRVFGLINSSPASLSHLALKEVEPSDVKRELQHGESSTKSHMVKTSSGDKKTLLKELAIVRSLQKEFTQESLAVVQEDPVERAAEKQKLEILKRKVDDFVRGVLEDSMKGDVESLLEEVKHMKRITEQYVFDAKKKHEKAERKNKKKQEHGPSASKNT